MNSGSRPICSAEEDAVAGDVLGVALRVAILGVDREDQALEDVERAASRLWPRRAAPAKRTASPPLALASWRVSAATVSRAVTESACSGNVQTPTLTVNGSRSEASNWSAWSASAVRDPLEDRCERGDRSGRRDEQELVRAVATEDRRRRQVARRTARRP